MNISSFRSGVKGPRIDTRHAILYGLTGAFAATLSFIPFTIFWSWILDMVLFSLFQLNPNRNTDDFQLIWVCILPAVIAGATGGIVFPYFRGGRYLLGKAVVGGLLASLLVALWMTNMIFQGWLVR